MSLTEWIEKQRRQVANLPLQQKAGAELILTELEVNPPRSNEVEGEWLLPKNAAVKAGVSLHTILRWKRQGIIPVKQPAGAGGRFLVYV